MGADAVRRIFQWWRSSLGLPLVCALFVSPGPAAALELDELAQCLAPEGDMQVAFRQERLVQSVDEMLESSGRLIYEPPSRLVMEQQEPRRERAVIEGDRMSVYGPDGGEVATFELASRPGMRVTFDGVRALLAGDAAGLRKAFDVTLQGNSANWQMELAPKDDDTRYHLQQITVDGGECQVAKIDVRMRDGGRRVIHLDADGASG